jgi:glycosyltransferase involved in cell wall biosynthesis
MKIVHISAFYSLENNYGASTRFKNLMDELANDKENQHIIIAPNYIDKRFSVLPLKDNYRLLKIIQIWNYLIACKPEIVVSDFLPTIFLRKSKLIYIIHDVRLKSGFEKSGLKSSKWIYRLILKQASKIITVSQFTKVELNEFYNGLISAVPNGVSKQLYFDPKIKKRGLIYVAKSEERKNIKRYLEVCDKYYSSTGEKSYLVSDHAGVLPEGCTLVSQLSDIQIADLYRSARCYVSTSNFEGFGMPLIEAYVSGCQLMISDIPAHQEVLQYMNLDYECTFNFSNTADEIVEKIMAQKFSVPDMRNFNLNWDKISDKFLLEITNFK